MSKIEVDAIDKQSGSTLTLGGSGTAVTLACGATQSGFGRTGTVNWNTTKKTGDFTATNGDGFFVDTGSGAVTATLPGSPSAGNIVAFSDYDGNFETNNLIIARNGSNINGDASNFTVSKNNVSLQLIYVDATEGWRIVLTGSVVGAGLVEKFITATGGTETTSGDCKIHTFTGPGTFNVTQVADCSANNAVGYLVVAGGGGTGRSYGGGAGAGGFREGRTNPITPYTASPLVTTGHTVSAQGYPITVGAGGAKSTPSAPANPAMDGSPSVFSSFTSTGGGGGGQYSNTICTPVPNFNRQGRPGGSGGGGGDGAPEIGSGNTPPVSPPQGQNGGAGGPGGSAGGGGATAVGTNGGSPSGSAGVGGAGATTHITGSPVAYAGGGGGYGSGGTGAAGTG